VSEAPKRVSNIGLIVILLKILSKMGVYLPKIFTALLKFFKAAKGFKIGMAVASFGSYAWLFSWQFALIIMGSIFLHELGHVRAMKAYGMKTKGIYFIPFLGAAAVMEDQFPSQKAEAVIALWGPIWGLILTMIFFDIYAWTGSPLMAGIAAWFALINLFNLLPIKPLDGGRIASSIAFSFSYQVGISALALGIFLALSLFFFTKASIFGLVLFIGSLELLAEWRRKPDLHGLRKSLIEKLSASFECDQQVTGDPQEADVVLEKMNEVLDQIAEEGPDLNSLRESLIKRLNASSGCDPKKAEVVLEKVDGQDIHDAIMGFLNRTIQEVHHARTFLPILDQANTKSGWGLLRKFYCEPYLLKEKIKEIGLFVVIEQILRGTLTIQETKRPPMDAWSIALITAGTVVTVALLISIMYLSGIDPASAAAFKILKS